MRRFFFGFFVLVTTAALVGACSDDDSTSKPTTDGGSRGDASSDSSSSADTSTTTDSSPNDSGSDGSTLVTSQAIITAYGGAAAGCQTVPGLSIGDFGDPGAGKLPRPVKNGATEDGGTVSVTCRVAPNGSGGFELDATTSYGGTTLTVKATLDMQGKTTAGKLNLAKVGGASWSNVTCSFDPSSSPSMGVAAGRYWALMSCGQSVSTNADTCDIFGQIRFENCTQS